MVATSGPCDGDVVEKENGWNQSPDRPSATSLQRLKKPLSSIRRHIRASVTSAPQVSVRNPNPKGNRDKVITRRRKRLFGTPLLGKTLVLPALE